MGAEGQAARRRRPADAVPRRAGVRRAGRDDRPQGLLPNGPDERVARGRGEGRPSPRTRRRGQEFVRPRPRGGGRPPDPHAGRGGADGRAGRGHRGERPPGPGDGGGDDALRAVRRRGRTRLGRHVRRGDRQRGLRPAARHAADMVGGPAAGGVRGLHEQRRLRAPPGADPVRPVRRHVLPRPARSRTAGGRLGDLPRPVRGRPGRPAGRRRRLDGGRDRVLLPAVGPAGREPVGGRGVHRAGLGVREGVAGEAPPVGVRAVPGRRGRRRVPARRPAPRARRPPPTGSAKTPRPSGCTSPGPASAAPSARSRRRTPPAPSTRSPARCPPARSSSTRSTPPCGPPQRSGTRPSATGSRRACRTRSTASACCPGPTCRPSSGGWRGCGANWPAPRPG